MASYIFIVETNMNDAQGNSIRIQSTLDGAMAAHPEIQAWKLVQSTGMGTQFTQWNMIFMFQQTDVGPNPRTKSDLDNIAKDIMQRIKQAHPNNVVLGVNWLVELLPTL